MAENETTNPEAPEAEVVTEESGRIKSFLNKHPRATKVAGVTVGIAAAVGVVAAVKNVRPDDQDDVDSEESEELFELSGAESPDSEA